MIPMPETRQLHLTMDLCLRIGELLLSSGAGAADVTATMQSVARYLGLRNPVIDVTFTSLSMGYHAEPEQPPVTLLRTVVHREIDYEDLSRVDHLVHQVLSGDVDVVEARAVIARINSTGHRRRRLAVTLGWGVMCAGVALMLGGDALVCGIAFAAAVSIDRTQAVMSRRRLPAFYQQVAGGAVATLLAVLAAWADLGLDPSLVVTANIVMLLSGIGFMGALQDCLSGFYVTGSARMTEALLATAGIIAGVSGGLAFADVVNVEVGPVDPGRSTWQTVTVLAAGAAICAAAFAFSSYAPKRTLVPVAAIAATAIVVAHQIEAGGFGRTWGVAVAAFVVGLVSWPISRLVKVPPLVVVVSAVVPLLPGLSIYRGLSLLSEDSANPAAAILALATAASIALALASGVILGEYVAQPLSREARKLERRLSGPRLVGPLRAKGGGRR
jgi:uncharacterized membrane protein YjjP (DUF1212 family)